MSAPALPSPVPSPVSPPCPAGAAAVIVGGGAAGLFAAAALREALVLERLPEPGRKLLVTGGGRCNVTHEATPDEAARAFRAHARFVRPAFAAFPPAAQRAWFEERGVPLRVEEGGLLFPRSDRASDVRDALLAAVRRAGGRIVAGARATRLLLAPDGASVRGVELAGGRRVESARVILAAGGSARPGLGTDGAAAALARAAGLAVAAPLPALGALHLANAAWLAPLAGLALPDAQLDIRRGTPGAPPRGTSSRGPLLVTGDGLSGPAALNLCADLAAALAAGASGAFLCVRWRADLPTPEAWAQRLEDGRRRRGSALVRNLLAETLPRSLAAALCREAGLAGDETVARLRHDPARRLAELCAATPLRVAATDGFGACMATRGGVAAAELRPATLESRRVRGLFCIGEAAEPAGDCGGYNLAWAWASARAAASAASLPQGRPVY